MDTRSGVEMPKYKAVIQAGGDATTSFDAVEYGMVPGTSSLEMEWAYGSDVKNTVHHLGASGTGLILYGFGSGSANLTTANNQALQVLYKNILKLTTSVDGMMILGELGETINMLRNPLSSLVGGVRKYLTNLGKVPVKGRNAQIVTQAVASTYLEAVFGWLPLISDINAIMATVNAQRNRIKPFRVTGKGSSESTTSLGTYANTTNNYLAYNVNIEDVCRTESRYIVGFKPDAFDAVQSLNRLYGFTPERFIPTMWELMPWSWLIDYFANIGTILEAACSTSFKKTFVCYNSRVTVQRTAAGTIDVARARSLLGSNKFISYSGSPGTTVSWKKTVSRRQLNTIPMPQFELKLPDYWKQWLNISAVSAQRAKIQKAFSNAARKR